MNEPTASPAEIIDADTLLRCMGYTQQGPCKKALEAQGIPVFEGRNGIWTTRELLTAAGLAKLGKEPPQTGAGDWL